MFLCVMIVNKNNKNNTDLRVLLSFILFFAVMFSVEAYESLSFFEENENESCTFENESFYESDRVVILNSVSGAEGFGHTTLLIERDDSWFYFSWQFTKVVFREVPSFAMSSLDSFNSWIGEEYSIQHYEQEYDSAILIRGDFSDSFSKAESVFEDYLSNQGLNSSNLGSLNDSSLDWNLEYNFLLNNCVDLSYEVLSVGFINCDESFGDVVERPSLIANVAMLQFKSELEFEEFSWIN